MPSAWSSPEPCGLRPEAFCRSQRSGRDTSLQFTKTDVIAMEREDLFIGLNEIKVAYVFRSTTLDVYYAQASSAVPLLF